MGYYRLDTFRELAEQGGYFLSRYKVGTRLYQHDGTELDLGQLLTTASRTGLDQSALLGRTHRLPVRLLAAPAPPAVSAQRRRQLKDQAHQKGQQASQARLACCDWTIYITNAPPSRLSRDEAMVLARALWQIEQQFNLWKQPGKIDEWRSANLWRILGEVYAKPVAVVILHWTLLTAVWMYPGRSLVKAAATVRRYAVMVAATMTGSSAVAAVIAQIGLCWRAGCRIERRQQRPSAYQLLLALTDDAY